MLIIKVEWKDYLSRGSDAKIISSRLVKNPHKYKNNNKNLLTADIIGQVGFTCLCDDNKTRLENVDGSFIYYGKSNTFETIEQAKEFAQNEIGVEEIEYENKNSQ
jgi:hypothetical protein